MNEDVTFEVKGIEGDLIKVALLCFDAESMSTISTSPDVLSLRFYNISLSRPIVHGPVSYRILYLVSKQLGEFMVHNDDAVLCFWCDAATDVPRNRRNLLPQEFRSSLFSRMFDRYVGSHGLSNFVNYRIGIDNNVTFAHFFCRESQLGAVRKVEQCLMQKP